MLVLAFGIVVASVCLCVCVCVCVCVLDQKWKALSLIFCGLIDLDFQDQILIMPGLTTREIHNQPHE